jgi:hypothetical protein
VIVDAAFAPDAEGYWEEHIIVVCDDHDGAARALVRAGPRLETIDINGVELRTVEEQVAASAGPGPIGQWCEYTSTPKRCERGPTMYLDTQEQTNEATATTAFAILREELLREGVEDARIEPQGPFDYYSTGEGIFLAEIDAIDIAPAPPVLDLIQLLERHMPEGCVLLFDGLEHLAETHASSDLTPVRRALPGRVGLDPQTVERFRAELGSGAVPPTGVMVIRNGEVLVLAPERAALRCFRVSRRLPPAAVDALRQLAEQSA